MQVQELMTTHLYTCQANDPLERAASIMWENDVGCVPIVDQGGHLRGVITDRDVCMAALLNHASLNEIPVSRSMQSQPVSCQAADSLVRALELMEEYQVRRLPVVDPFGKLTGLITQNDLVREATHETRGSRPELGPAHVLRTLDAIGAPRHQMLAAAS